MQQKRYPEGHFIGLGIAIGIPLGMPIGLAIGNIALGPGIGTILGVPIGIVLEKRKNPNPRKLTKGEEKIRKRNLMILLVLGIIVFVALISAFFFLR